MKRKYLVVAAGVIVVVASVFWLRYRILANRDEAEFQEQLRLARAEGLPTNAAEFAATIQPANPSENAAPFYRQLKAMLKPLGVFPRLDEALLRHSSPTTLAAAQALIVKAKAPLDTMDQATALPRCWFDRKWSDGYTVLFPELADMKYAAKLLCLRGSVAATNGDTLGALKSAREVFVMSKHASEEGISIPAMAGEAIYSIGLHELANWCVVHPSVAAYREALAEALKNQPEPDPRRELRDRLFLVLSTIDRSSTQVGREKLGQNGDDPSPVSGVFSIFLSKAKAKIAIVKADREYWAALKLPRDQIERPVAEAAGQENMALWAFPEVAKEPGELSGPTVPANRYSEWQMRRLGYAAVLRAVSNGGIAHSIQTADLKSPEDGQPITYSFDGKQIVIAVSRLDDKPYKFWFPPDVLK